MRYWVSLQLYHPSSRLVEWMSLNKHCLLGKMLFLSSIKSWYHLLSFLFRNYFPMNHGMVSVGTWDGEFAVLLAEHKGTLHASASGTYLCVFDVLECFGLHPCPWINACSCVRLLACTFRCVLSIGSGLFFYALKAILRVTFQKPWRAALLSVCARLCDSVWVEKAQGHISGPLPITELHSLQTILWWGESGGIVD